MCDNEVVSYQLRRGKLIDEGLSMSRKARKRLIISNLPPPESISEQEQEEEANKSFNLPLILTGDYIDLAERNLMNTINMDFTVSQILFMNPDDNPFDFGFDTDFFVP